MAPGQRGLDGRLALQQPVQRGVEFVVVDRTEAEHFAEAGSGGGRRQRSCGGQLRCRFENAADEQGEDEVAAAIAVGAEDAVEADLACRAKGGGDVAVRQRAGDGEGVVPGGDDSAASQHTAQAFDMGRGPVGEVAEGALTDPALLAVRLTQQDGRRRVPVRDGFDIHGLRGADSVASYKSQIGDYMATFWRPARAFCQDFRRFGSIGKREARSNQGRAPASQFRPPEPRRERHPDPVAVPAA